VQLLRRSKAAGEHRTVALGSIDGSSKEGGADAVNVFPFTHQVADLAITGASPQTCGSGNTSARPLVGLLDVHPTCGIIVSAP
jgi:hypothetical protein